MAPRSVISFCFHVETDLSIKYWAVKETSRPRAYRHYPTRQKEISRSSIEFEIKQGKKLRTFLEQIWRGIQFPLTEECLSSLQGTKAGTQYFPTLPRNCKSNMKYETRDRKYWKTQWVREIQYITLNFRSIHTKCQLHMWRYYNFLSCGALCYSWIGYSDQCSWALILCWFHLRSYSQLQQINPLTLNLLSHIWNHVTNK